MEQICWIRQFWSLHHCNPKYNQKLERDKVHQFLLGLNEFFFTIMGVKFLENQIQICQPLAKNSILLLKRKNRDTITEKRQQQLEKRTTVLHFSQRKLTKNLKKREEYMYRKRSGMKLDTSLNCDYCNFFGHIRKDYTIS